LLIEQGADVNATDSQNLTPLTLAIAEGHRDIVKILQDAATKQKEHAQESGARQELADKGIRQTGKREWVATLPPDADNERGR
jgi:ankyrin repeat protein